MKREITCDESGVRITLEGGAQQSGIAWSEIHSISGHKLDCISRIVTIVDLDFANGHFVELISDDIGFDAAIGALGSRVHGISVNWFAAISNLGPQNSPLLVWRADHGHGA